MPSPRSWTVSLAIAAILTAGLGAAGVAVLKPAFLAELFGGESADPARPAAITVAGEALEVPKPLIRFTDQRRPGVHGRVDLAFVWPTLAAAGLDAAVEPASLGPDSPIVFLSIEPRDGQSDTSSRVATVYRRFFAGPEIEGPDGLVGRRMRAGSGYEDEILFLEPTGDRPFAARCFATTESGRAEVCLREIAAGRGLSVTYRFRYPVLADWRELDAAVLRLVGSFARQAPSGAS